MRESESPVAATARKMRESPLSRRATDCPRNVYVLTARAVWPKKTAVNWAAAAGKAPSIGKVWLRGKVSEAGKLAIIHLFD